MRRRVDPHRLMPGEHGDAVLLLEFIRRAHDEFFRFADFPADKVGEPAAGIRHILVLGHNRDLGFRIFAPRPRRRFCAGGHTTKNE